MVIREFLREEAKKLSGSPSAALFDVEVLAAHVLGISRSGLLIHAADEITDAQKNALSAFVTRRAAGEPVAYLIGEKEFMGLSFSVGEGVLIPRPDTETLVEWALSRYEGKAPRILDICTGSGCIAVSMAHFLPRASVTAYDLSPAALLFAEKNAQQNHVHLSLVQNDILTEPISGTFDLILSNPPYISSNAVDSLMPEVKDFEPRLALEGGEDGLLFYPVIAKKAYAALSPGGHLAVEIGFDQGEAVCEIMKPYFKEVSLRKDLGGNDRVVIGQK